MTRRAHAALFAAALAFAPAALADWDWPDFSGPLRELKIVRDALRDGLWKVADSHAERAEGATTNAAQLAEIRLARLEALAKAGDAKAVERQLAEWPAAETRADSFRWWRAWSAAENGRPEAARAELAARFADPAYALLALRLEARLAVADGDRANAEKLFAAAAAAVGADVQARAENALEWSRFRLAGGDADGALAVLQVQRASECKDATGDEAASLEADLLAASGKKSEARAIRERLAAKELPRGLLRHVRLALAREDLADAKRRVAACDVIRKLLRESPDDAECQDAWLALADAMLAAGENEVAAKEFRLFVESYPKGDVAHALEGRGWALAALGRNAEAVGAFAGAAQAATNDVAKSRCMAKRGDALLAAGRAAEAAAAFAEVPGEEAAFRSADAHERAGDKAKAEKIYSSLASSTNVALAAESSLRLAGFASAAGDAAKALAVYDALLAKDGVDDLRRSRAHAGRGRARYRAMRFAEAAEDFRAAGRLDPKRADEMRFLAALSLYGDGRDSDARAEAAALKASATNATLKADLALWLAKCDFNRGDWAAAEKGFSEAAATLSDPSRRADAWLLAGRAAGARNDFSQSVKLLSNALKAMPENDPRRNDAYLAQGEALTELARFDEAVYVLERVAKDGENAHRAAMLKADALFALGADDDSRYAAALEAYRAVLRADPAPSERIAAEFKIGRTLEKQRKFDEAADQYYSRVVLAYADARKKGARFDSSARGFFARAAFALADHYEAHGDDRAALGVLRLVVASGEAAADEARRRIGSIKAKGGL